MKKVARTRKSGLDFVGDIAWGTHMCQFYQTKEDLLDVLVPYFIDGLKNNELCVWVTSDFLNTQEAVAAMQKAMPNFNTYLAKGQMEIFPYTEWYLKEGTFELQRVLRGWVEKHDKAITCQYAGMRVTGNPFWIDNKKDWADFTEYEAEINNVIDDYKMLVLCTYSLNKCSSDEIIDVLTNHKFCMIKRLGKWTLLENSAQKRIEEAFRKTQAKFSDLYNSMTEGVAFHDIIYDKQDNAVDYVITDINPAFEQITGICKEEAVGKKASELYGTLKPPYLDVYSNVATSGEAYKFETYFPPMEKHFSISCVSSSKGKFATVFYDITEPKRIQESLKQRTIQLMESQHKLEEHAVLLEEYATQMEDLANQRLSQLKDAERLAAIGATAGMVGHDIRNPLQTIIGELYFAKKDLEKLSVSKEKDNILDNVKTIEASLDYINKIVQDLQDFARPIKINLEKADIQKLLKESLISMNPPNNTAITCQVDESCRVQITDSILLRRVLSNLISNSIQAMPNGGKINIQAFIEDSATIITISDTGSGIPDEIKPKLFMPLMTTKSKGQGFGLAVVKRMTEALGGTVTFESQTGVGTKFTLRFPLKKALDSDLFR